jgi:hypothetical protein
MIKEKNHYLNTMLSPHFVSSGSYASVKGSMCKIQKNI